MADLFGSPPLRFIVVGTTRRPWARRKQYEREAIHARQQLPAGVLTTLRIDVEKPVLVSVPRGGI